MTKTKKTTKPDLPPALPDDDEDDARFRSKLEALSARFGYGAAEPRNDGAPSSEPSPEPLMAAEPEPRPTPAPPPRAPKASGGPGEGRPAHRQRKVTFEVSDDLLHLLEMEAARRRVSQRLLLVEGLAALGLAVPEIDRRDWRRRRR